MIDRQVAVSAALCLVVMLSGCGRKPALAPGPGRDGMKVSEVRFADALYKARLSGVYDGTQGWRWAARNFSVRLDAPPPFDAPTALEMDLAVPAEVIQAAGELNVRFQVNGKVVGKRRYKAEGRHTEMFPLEAGLLRDGAALVEVQSDGSHMDAATGNDVALIVVTASLKHGDTAVLDQEAATELARRGYAELLQRRKLEMTDAQQTEMMRLFHRIPVWDKMWFHNVPIGKNPLDLWMMQQIMFETQPDFVVETGTFRGGSALYWAHTLNGLGLEKSQVITCDIGDYTATAATHPLWKKYVHFLKGSSTDPAIVAQIAKQVSGHKVLVTLDSDHSQAHVLKELQMYAPMVNKGSYLVVEDTHLDGVPTAPDAGPGPMAAVLEFLKEGGDKDFEQDLSREAFVMTFNPGGWLRRK